MRALTHRLLGIGALTGAAFTGYALRRLASPPAKAPPTVNFHAVVKKTPLGPEGGAALTPVFLGTEATVNVWQLTGKLPAHYHRKREEYVLVLEGEGQVRLGKETRRLRPGDLVRVPKGMIHAVQARGGRPFRGVSFFAPAFQGRDRIFLKDR